jgi:hypothetical protein
MLNIEDIKKEYSAMTDEELLKLDRYEDHDLTSEAFAVLQAELRKRNLDQAAAKGINLNIDSIEKRRLVAVKNEINREHIRSIWDYVFDSKDKGLSDAEILGGLIAKGLDKGAAERMIQMLEDKSRQTQKSGREQMLGGGIGCMAGVALTYLSYSMTAERGGPFILAWGAIIFGAIFFFRGLSIQDKHKRILLAIEEERREAKVSE